MFSLKKTIVALLSLSLVLTFLSSCSETTGSDDENNIFGTWINESGIEVELTEEKLIVIDNIDTLNIDTLVNGEYYIVSDDSAGVDYYLVNHHIVEADEYNSIIGYNGGFTFTVIGDSLEMKILNAENYWYDRIQKDDYQIEIAKIMKSGVNNVEYSQLVFTDDSTGIKTTKQILRQDTTTRESDFEYISDTEIEMGSERFSYKKFGISWIVINYEIEEAVLEAVETIILTQE